MSGCIAILSFTLLVFTIDILSGQLLFLDGALFIPLLFLRKDLYTQNLTEMSSNIATGVDAFAELPTGNVTNDIIRLIKAAGIEKYDVKVSPGSQHGDNYLGTVHAVDITGTSENQTPKSLSLIIKSSPRTPQMRKMMEVTKIYKKEIAVYENYIPKILSIQNVGNGAVVDGFLPTAKLFGSSSIENDEYLILSNMKREGFVMVSRLEPLPYDHVEFVLRQIGYLHALSVLFKQQNREMFYELSTNLMIDIMDSNPDMITAWGQMVQASILKAVACFDPVEDKDVCDRLQKYKETAFDRMRKTTKLSTFIDDPYSVFIHGDCWSNNILYKYNDSKKLISTCFLDWQIARLASPACELSYFIYNCCGPEDLKLRFDEMIKIYYNSFSSMLRKHDVIAEEVLPFGVLQQHIKQYFHSGLTMALHTMPMFTSNSDEIPHFDNIDNFDDDELKKWLFTSKNHHIYVKRIRGVILHAISLGIL